MTLFTLDQVAERRGKSLATSPLSRQPDPAILEIARALARQAAREDHAREQSAQKQGD